MNRLDQLTEELCKFQSNEGLEFQCANEQLSELLSKQASIDDQISFLKDFIARWEKAEQDD